jgi:four helix bundle protein
MTEPIFDHERLDIYRLAIQYVTSSYRIAKLLNGPERHARDQWLRAAQSIPLNISEGNGKQSLKDKNRFFEIARGSALECAAIHDILSAFEAIDSDLNRDGKTKLKRIVSMLTRLIQRTDSVSENWIEYEYEYRDAEYEYRDAEYEYEKTHEQSIGPKCSIERLLTCVELSPGIRSMQPICTEVLH